MACKAHKRAKTFRMHCREQTAAGLVSDPRTGNWVKENDCETKNAAIRDVLQGSRFGKGKARTSHRKRGPMQWSKKDCALMHP